MMAHTAGRDLFVQDTYAGADPRYRLPVRIITELAWHSLFARTMFINKTTDASANFTPDFTIINIPSFKADPATDGTRAPTFILMDFTQRLVLIGGTSYAGETKKSVFTILNYLLPQRGVMSMHCSANVGDASDVAIFFGLSGTGKTTLSADPERQLIGDDEHGWSEDGVFNFEGGCYAKVIRLSPEAEPDIYRTTRMFGTVMENVVYDPVTRVPDLDSAAKTENTRAAYPLTSIPNIMPEGYAGHPRNIIMLTADAFGVLPPVARLTPEQAMYHFLSGYTAKVAGTERGVTEPEATFSTCFGAPFMVLHPGVYADLLGQTHARAQLGLLACQHGLVRRPLRRRAAHVHQAYACHDPRHPRRLARRRRDAPRSGLRRRRAHVLPRCTRRSADAAQHLARHRSLRPQGARPRPSLQRELQEVRIRRQRSRARRRTQSGLTRLQARA